MSQGQENAGATDNVAPQGEQALAVLRDIWHARQQTSADIEEACGNTKTCKNLADVGFQGLADPDGIATTNNAGVGNDLRVAWKRKLEREGKLHPGTSSVRELVLGSAEPE